MDNHSRKKLNIKNDIYQIEHKEQSSLHSSGKKEPMTKTLDFQKQDNQKKNDKELADDEMEEIVGGLASVAVPICTNCHKRIAVYQMKLCAVCFLKLK